MIDENKLHDDVFNPTESDLDYFLRRLREMELARYSTVVERGQICVLDSETGLLAQFSDERLARAAVRMLNLDSIDPTGLTWQVEVFANEYCPWCSAPPLTAPLAVVCEKHKSYNRDVGLIATSVLYGRLS